MEKRVRHKGIVLLLVALIAFSLLAGGASSSLQYNVQISHSGKGEAAITVQTEEALEEFRERVEAVLEDYRILSTDDMYNLKEIKKTEGGYIVSVTFRRIDKIAGMGTTDIAEATEYFVETSEAYTRLLGWESGNLRVTVPMMIDHRMGTVRIKSGNGYPVLAKDESGGSCSLEKIGKDRETVENSKIITLGLLQMEGVVSFRIRVPGRIRYYAGGNCKLVAEDTIEYYPLDTPVVVEVSDDEGNPVFIEKSSPTVFGYILFEPSLSPLEIVIISVVSAAVVAAITATLIYLYRRGKRVLTQQKEEIDS